MAKQRTYDKKGLRVWLDGKLVSYGAASVPLLTHSLQYGSGVFEGIRAHRTESGPAVFRLPEHMDRFLNSAKIHGLRVPFSRQALERAAVSVVRANGFEECYLRPFAFYRNDEIGMTTIGKEVSVAIAAVPFGDYFGAGRERGISCKVSSWKRINSSILPVRAKASGNYLNSIIANREARLAGYNEAILLSENGFVAEGSGENVFLVKDNRLITPSEESDILLGITRDTVIKIAQYTGFQVVERLLHREELYTADEAFFTGTAAEVTPIVNVDGTVLGTGRPGPITKLLASKYSDIVAGRDPEFRDWLTFVK